MRDAGSHKSFLPWTPDQLPNMYSLLFIAAVLSLAVAAPQRGPIGGPIGVPIGGPIGGPTGESLAFAIDEYNDFSGASPWKWGFHTSNGIARDETGHITDEGTDDEALEVEGSYSWTAPDGVTYTVRYRAGRDGYQAFSEHTGGVGIGRGPTETVVVNAPGGRQVLPVSKLVGK